MTWESERTLAEQMHVTDFEIGLRKRLCEFTDADFEALASFRNPISVNVDAIVAEFYERLTKFPEIALVIGDQETLAANTGPDAAERLGMARRAIQKSLLLDAGLVFDTYVHGMSNALLMAKEQAERHAASLEEQFASRARQLQSISESDLVTGLPNRTAFEKQFRTLLALADRTGGPISIAYLDINDFKRINDREGHAAGDNVLRLVAQAMIDTKRRTDLAARQGGDEFILLMPGARIADAHDVANRLVTEIEAKGQGKVTVARTLADLDGKDAVRRAHVAEALSYRRIAYER